MGFLPAGQLRPGREATHLPGRGGRRRPAPAGRRPAPARRCPSQVPPAQTEQREESRRLKSLVLKGRAAIRIFSQQKRPSSTSSLGKSWSPGVGLRGPGGGGLTPDTRDGQAIFLCCFCLVLFKLCLHVEGAGGALSEGQDGFHHHGAWPGHRERATQPGVAASGPAIPQLRVRQPSPHSRQLPPSSQGPHPELYLNLMLERPRKSSCV